MGDILPTTLSIYLFIENQTMYFDSNFTDIYS